MPTLKVKRLVEEARLPEMAHDGDSCWDLFSTENICLTASRTQAVKTGLAMAIPKGWELQIRPRSGMALKKSITIVNSPGTIDSGYRGEVMVPMKIDSCHITEYFIHTGDKIAQCCLKRVYDTEIVEVDELDETDRGEGGFGSSGK